MVHESNPVGVSSFPLAWDAFLPFLWPGMPFSLSFGLGCLSPFTFYAREKGIRDRRTDVDQGGVQLLLECDTCGEHYCQWCQKCAPSLESAGQKTCAASGDVTHTKSLGPEILGQRDCGNCGQDPPSRSWAGKGSLRHPNSLLVLPGWCWTLSFFSALLLSLLWRSQGPDFPFSLYILKSSVYL